MAAETEARSRPARDAAEQQGLRHRVQGRRAAPSGSSRSRDASLAPTFTITRSEIGVGRTSPNSTSWRLVEVDARCGQPQVRYVRRAFEGMGEPHFASVAEPSVEQADGTGGDASVTEKKLIEVALPLEAINAACKADKDRKTGTVRNLHKWFAPMPPPAWRALLLAALIDDPEDESERRQLLDLLEELCPETGETPPESVIERARFNPGRATRGSDDPRSILRSRYNAA